MNALEKKKLKSLAHPLKAVVYVGQAGVTDAVINEINIALDAHELIKIKIRADRDERKIYAEYICRETQAELIQSIGQIIIVYRKNVKKKAKKS